MDEKGSEPNRPAVDGERIRTILDEYEGPLLRYAARITGDVERARDSDWVAGEGGEREQRERAPSICCWV